MFFSESTGGFYATEIHGGNIPSDSVEISAEYHTALMDGQSSGKRIVCNSKGFPVLLDQPMPTQEQVIAQYESYLDSHLDNVAKQYRYKDRFSFATRAGYVGPYQSEGIAFAQWMDNCNVQSFALLSDVLAGNAELPTIEEFIGGLPEFVLP